MNTASKTTLLIVSGIICQLIGLFCFWTFWLMNFAVAFFILGTILIFVSRKKWITKIACIIPMLYAIGIIVNALFFEKYIIPENFKGVVYVITDKQNGKDREYNFFTRIFRIPQSGVLFTKFNQKAGFNNRSFFQIDKSGNLKELDVLDYRDYIEKWVVNPPKTEPSRDSFAVFTPELDYDFHSKKYMTIFTVGKYNDIKIWNYLPPEKIDSLKILIAK